MNYILLLKVAQISLAVVLTVLVLLQSKNAGLSYGLKSSFSMYRSLRGVEKLVFTLTIIAGVMLVVNSLFLLAIS